jgi:hypothetical protein
MGVAWREYNDWYAENVGPLKNFLRDVEDLAKKQGKEGDQYASTKESPYEQWRAEHPAADFPRALERILAQLSTPAFEKIAKFLESHPVEKWGADLLQLAGQALERYGLHRASKTGNPSLLIIGIVVEIIGRLLDEEPDPPIHGPVYINP